MKIGILTYHAACNFGANLQALSTANYFLSKGYQVKVINFLPKELDTFYKKKTPELQYETHKLFREQLLPLTSRCENEIEVADVINREKIDMVVIGSDAVMQHHPLRSRIVFPCKRIFYIYSPTKDRMCPNPFWGSFLHLLERKIPICYMSASSQNSAYKQLSSRERNLLCNHLLQFSYISTRDDWSSKMVSYITRNKIAPNITPDPVFAFNYNVHNQISEEEIRKKYHIEGKYYLLSFHNSKTVSQEWLTQFEKIANSNNIQCIALPFPQGIEFKHPYKKEIKVPLPPLDWYSLIKYSEGYIGHNMHPIVVSLHNAIPCFSFDNYGIVKWRVFVNEQSSKIYHIMRRFGVLSNRVRNVGINSKIPSPQEVFYRLQAFDRQLVASHATDYLNEYLNMMSDIESILKEKI